MFVQRYIEHFPAGGEIVIFDRSWYNRAGVERVMGYVDEQQSDRFLEPVSGGRETNRRFRHHADQDLAGSQHEGAGEAVCRSH